MTTFKKTLRKKVLPNLLIVVILAVFLFPIYWIIISSFKTDTEVLAVPPTFWPRLFSLNAYHAQFTSTNVDFWVSVKNSFINAMGSLIVSCLLGIPCAYGLARFRVPGRKAFILVFLVSQMMPASLLLTPMYLTYSKLGMLNNYFSPILSITTAGIPFIVVMLRPFFLSLPRALEDSARVDGCNTFGAFIRIMLPIAVPGVITAACFTFLFGWSDLIYSITFNPKGEFRTMTALIYNYITMYGLKWNNIMAFGVLLVTPPLLMLIFLQKYIVSGLVGGAIKE